MPIGASYAAQFHGNGHTVANLTVSSRTISGLFQALASGGGIRDVGIIDPNISGSFSVGGLVATINAGAEVTASYVRGGTTTLTGPGHVGGLAAWHTGAIRAAYAGTTVSAGTVANAGAGGLVGNANGSSAITASYAAGPVSVTGNNTNVGGLVANVASANVASANAAITASYCDITVIGATTPCLGAVNGSAASMGYTTAQLYTPTGYTGIYANWNISLDADAFPDNPWNFGANTTTPIHTTIAQRQAAMDYDANDNNLIDTNTLHQLNAIRHDLNGDGLPAAAASYVAYAGTFPGGNLANTGAPYMGCLATCAGYELTANLDFPADGSAVTTTDPYPEWTPIGTAPDPYAAAFNGNGRTIARLTTTGVAGNAGLFHT